MHLIALLSFLFQFKTQTMPFVSQRVSKTATFEIQAPADAVFPFFGPIKEKEWAYGWDPQRIYPEDASMEEHMIFQSKSSNAHESYFIWMVTKLDVSARLIEYTVSTPNRIWTIGVQCQPQGSNTKVVVTYTYTGLNELGNELNRKALDQMYTEDLKDWERALNHYLQTGEMLKALHH